MEYSLGEVQVAIRVLNAFTLQHTPDPADVTQLRQFVHGEVGDLTDDELACQVVQQFLKYLGEVRQKSVW